MTSGNDLTFEGKGRLFPELGIVALRSGVAAAVLALTVKDHLATRIYAVVDPRKLAQVKRVLDT